MFKASTCVFKPLLLAPSLPATVSLYNCSVGRDDCSLCRHASAPYQCVWCSSSRSCVYHSLCPSPQPTQCPAPKITDVSHTQATPPHPHADLNERSIIFYIHLRFICLFSCIIVVVFFSLTRRLMRSSSVCCFHLLCSSSSNRTF